jgi:hypothetical protein
MNRDVSGRKKEMRRKQLPEEMARIQKIQRQPGCWAKAPPRTGPTAIAELGLYCYVSIDFIH